MATVNLGRVSFVMKGDYNASATYKRLDVVTSNGTSYAAKQDVPAGTALSNTTYWQVQTQKGADGSPGATGAKGSDGLNYDVSVDGSELKFTPMNDVSDVINDLKSSFDELFNVSDNLFDYTQSKVNQLPNSWAGQTYNDFSTLNGWKTSNLIPVEAGKQYCVIENGILKNSYLVNFYGADTKFISQINMGLETLVTAPTDAEFMYMYKSGTNPDFSSSTIAIKEYNENMDYIVRPYGGKVPFLTQPFIYGLYKNDNDLYHFTQVKDSIYLIRHFTRFGINNLLDLKGMYFGEIVGDNLVFSSTIGTTTTDTIGPVSIHRGSVDGYSGAWSGGCHGVTVDGTEYPTAEQTDLKVYCNGVEIIGNGMYWGPVSIVASNDLYFPKSVTGSDLTSAVKAIKETRYYYLTTVMTVKVSLGFYAETCITQYYGCQCATFDMTTLRMPNNETVQNITRTTNYIGTVKETTLVADNTSAHYEVSVKPIGLGTFSKNTGTASDVGYCYLSTFNKFYFVLIANELNIIRKGLPENEFYWEGVYNYYIN